MKKKILYLFSDTGGGHRSAATAVMRAVDHLRHENTVQEMVDVFAACSGFLNVFARLYAPVIKYSPRLWGQLYYWLDDEKKLEQLEKLSRPFIFKELVNLLLEKRPDVVVSVHPLVNHLAVKAIKESGLKIPFIVVITDPVTLHRAWIMPEVDLCIVATPEAKKMAVRYGMPEKKIRVIGMPIDPKFFLRDRDKKKAKVKDALNPKLFTILLMGGGEGAGTMGKIVDEFARTGFKGQLIVIAGRNKRLETKLKSKKYGFPMKVFGFTDKVPGADGRVRHDHHQGGAGNDRRGAGHEPADHRHFLAAGPRRGERRVRGAGKRRPGQPRPETGGRAGQRTA